MLAPAERLFPVPSALDPQEPLTPGPSQDPAAAPPAQVQVPARWAELPLPPHATAVRLGRRFGAPPLEAHEQVWLVITGLVPGGSCELNGTPLPLSTGESGQQQCEITPRLAPRNRLSVMTPLPSSESADPLALSASPGPFWEVRLEIRSSIASAAGPPPA